MPQQQQKEDPMAGKATTLIPCPKCGSRELQFIGEESDHEETPEGLSGVTRAQCQSLTCLHEFTVVTHRQILSSIRSWTNAGHLIR